MSKTVGSVASDKGARTPLRQAEFVFFSNERSSFSFPPLFFKKEKEKTSVCGGSSALAHHLLVVLACLR